MRRSLVSVVAAALLWAVLPVTPASATAVSGVTIGFAGTATLGTFPCPPPPSTSCTGSMSNAAWAGHASGEWNSGAFDVSWENINGLSATFTYWEHSCVEPTSTVAGSAYGVGSAIAGPGQIRGNWQGYGELPRDITGARLWFAFDWFRAGTEALISFRAARLDVEIAGFGWQTIADAAAPALASFVPTPAPAAHLPTCTNPTTMKGQVAGTVAMTT